MKKSFWVIALLLCVSMFFLSSCSDQEDNVVSSQYIAEEVSKVSLQRLVEMHHDQTVSQELYDDIEKRTSSLSDQEYELYMELWAKDEVNSSIKLNVISEDSRKDNEQKLLLHLQARNQKAKELYGMSMNKLSENQQDVVMKNILLPEANSSNKLYARSSGCSKYYYGYSTTNNGSGLTSCSGYVSATNLADTDCDYEFIFYPGPITYTAANLKTKGITSVANAVLNSGGINGRVSGNSFCILVGYGAILKKYPSSIFGNASAFSSAFKFRWLV